MNSLQTNLQAWERLLFLINRNRELNLKTEPPRALNFCGRESVTDSYFNTLPKSANLNLMPVPKSPLPLWRRLLRLLALLIVLFLCGSSARFFWMTRDRNPGYTLNLSVSPSAAIANPKPLKAGFGRRIITPDISNPARPVWLAGFDQGRSALRVHDDLYAVAIVIDDGSHRIGVVSIDSIGLFHDDTLAIRRALADELNLDYVTVCATHNHSTPDLMGLWGRDILHSGVDPEYRARVIRDAAASLTDAVKSLQPVRLTAHEIISSPEGLVADTRKPEVFDADLRVLHCVSIADGQTLGSLVGWGNHPETPWADNRDLTADFPGIIRNSLEKGIIYDGKVHLPGLGGIHVFVNGAVGGLMTTHPSVTVKDPFIKADFKIPSHDKTRAVGNVLVARILNRLATNTLPSVTTAPIAIEAQTLEIPVANRGFLVAGFLGLLDRGHSKFLTMRTEIAVIQIGTISITCIPGEIYPELVNGGVVKTPGGDFNMEPLEIPPLRELMPGQVKFIFGLANDEIGYIIPKSEWDMEAPFNYGAKGAPYGEINSLGPETARLLHTALSRLCKKIQAQP